ncbi:hypothetical protein [Geothrix edaphica]|uniref:PilC beta-propeller domain-containing protein n=1 Tax=Geothrix edaphica TaxID=2927976 RepID=A0ABQ5Q0D8_9BACT|nr:hypothetical protein [Geothrix edaphica]GLH67766.1 hypothetical protein GETHED_21300 [Geothrix edaphica]
MNMRSALHRGLRGILVAFLFVPFAQAQIEPQLMTKTDLLDVYQADAGHPQLVTVLDFTTGSRAVFEPGKYLTQPTRTGWLGGVQSFGDPIGLGAAGITDGKDYGFIFVMKSGTHEVYLQRWPNSKQIYGTTAGVPYVGVPYDFRSSFVGTPVTDTDPAVAIPKITHVRFTINGRSVDLPCPSRLFDSPYTFTSKDAYTLGTSTNVSKHANGTVIYDKWSDSHPTLTDDDPALALALNGTVLTGYTAIGNFFYTYDYLSWIFGATQVRNADGTGVVNAPTSGVYASPRGYAVPDTTENVSYPTGLALTYDTNGKVVSGTVQTSVGSAEGWKNGLPVMTRYQSEKVAGINVFLNIGSDSNVDWIYRFLDPYVDNALGSEEGGSSNSAGIPANPNQSAIWNDATRGNRKFVRKLLSADLASNDTALQKMGPSGWFSIGTTVKVRGVDVTTYDAMDLFNFGGRSNPDPRTPQPWAYALANTYYRATVEKNSSIFTAGSNACPGKAYVLIFPTLGVTDSYGTASVPLTTTNVNQAAAAAYITYTEHGNKYLMGGSYLAMPTASSLLPGTEFFHPQALASVAAYQDGSANSGPWGAAWEVNPATTRGPSNPGTQTMVISLGIPGSYKLKAGNNARNPEEAYFRIAQASDPSRTDLGYGKWQSANGRPDDASVLDGGKVYYYYSTDPAALEKNWDDVLQKIVAGSASLSAPATPSTGARTTTQAYFGIFKTSRTPVWSGNLYSVGIKRVIDPTTKKEVFSFYGNTGESTIGCVPLFDTDGNPILDASGKPVTQCGLNNFDDHHLWSAFDIFGNYLATELPAGTTVHTENVLGSPKLWSNRTIFTLLPGSTPTKVSFESNYTSPDSDPLISALRTTFAGLFPAGTSDTDKNTAINGFIDFYRGKNITDPSKNRIGIFGDIINSAPLAVELSSDNLPSGVAWPSTAIINSSPVSTKDPHVRLLLVGTNGGMLHCFVEQAYALPTADPTFDQVTAKANELWAFVPPDMLSTMFSIYLNRGVKDAFKHRYLVDGDPSLFHEDKAPTGQILGDTRVSANEDAIVVFGMRKGARSYYALGLTSSSDSAVQPDAPKILWILDPQKASSSDQVKKMGMSTAVPTFAYVSTDGTVATRKAAVFLSGGYANAQVNSGYLASGTITNGEGMGRSIIALQVKDGSVLKSWDWSSSASVGAIPAGVTPVAIFQNSDLIQRIYFADMNGNVMALNGDPTQTNIVAGTGVTNATAPGFRVDSSDITKWLSGTNSPRFIYKNSAFRFTTRPDAFRLSGNYPVPIVDPTGGTNPTIKPITVMVSIGSGDWNNPADMSETYTGNTTVQPPSTNRMFVFADRQDSANLDGGNRDTNGILDSNLQEITDNTKNLPSPPGVNNSTNWVTTYSSSKVTPGSSDYIFKLKSGYYYSLLDGTLPKAVGGKTHDKLLVSPLTKEGTIFFSLFNINGNSGFGCASNAFTRTFRECDILRPLAIATEVNAPSTVSDISSVDKGQDSCTGLAFFFNSLSSQLADAGDRVVQGGAVSSKTGSFDQQTGANTPDIKFVKDSDINRGFKLRTWRVIR